MKFPQALLLTLAGLLAVDGLSRRSLESQSPAPVDTRSFDVVSVKRNNSGARGRGFGFPSDRFSAYNVTLRELIAVAYGMPGWPPRPLASNRILGGPDWIHTSSFNIDAKASSGLPRDMRSGRQKLSMLRTALEDRFALVAHEEIRERPIYALATKKDGKLGPGLHRSALDCSATNVAGRNSPPPGSPAAGGRITCGAGANLLLGQMVGGGMTIADLAYLLSTVVDRVVVDRTGLTGGFDLDLRFNPEGLQSPPRPPDVDRSVSDAPSVFTALDEQLGLKLESTRGPIDVLLIDSVRQPTPD